MRHPAALALGTLALVLAAPLQAQTDDPAPGTRVRVWPACPTPEASKGKCAPVIGRLLSRDTAGVLVEREGTAADTLPIASVARLEMSAGPRHRTLLGFGVGAAVGFGAGMILAGRAGCNTGIFSSGEDADICGAYGIAIPIGAVLGAVVGRLIRSERWLPLGDLRPTLRLAPGPQRLGLHLTLPF